MKRKTILILFIVFATVTGIYTAYETKTHKCVDPTHVTCDGECECDGMACPPIKDSECKSWYYHIELEDSAMIITQHGRFVASVPYDKSGMLDSIFIKDNE